MVPVTYTVVSIFEYNCIIPEHSSEVNISNLYLFFHSIVNYLFTYAVIYKESPDMQR